RRRAEIDLRQPGARNGRRVHERQSPAQLRAAVVARGAGEIRGGGQGGVVQLFILKRQFHRGDAKTRRTDLEEGEVGGWPTSERSERWVAKRQEAIRALFIV